MFVKLIVKAINEINEMKLCNFFFNIWSYDFGRDNLMHTWKCTWINNQKYIEFQNITKRVHTQQHINVEMDTLANM
jgi:hypothetical protein